MRKTKSKLTIEQSIMMIAE